MNTKVIEKKINLENLEFKTSRLQKVVENFKKFLLIISKNQKIVDAVSAWEIQTQAEKAEILFTYAKIINALYTLIENQCVYSENETEVKMEIKNAAEKSIKIALFLASDKSLATSDQKTCFILYAKEMVENGWSIDEIKKVNDNSANLNLKIQ